MVLLVSCMNGIEPLPSDTEDLSMSLSFPVLNGKVGTSDTYYIGLPNINIGEDVPDWAKHDTLYYSDTLPVDLYQVYQKSSAIKYLALKVNVWNEYPIDGIVKMYIADSNGAVLYPFWDNHSFVIPRGEVFANGRIFKPSYKGSSIVFNSEQIENLRNAQSIIVDVRLGLKGYKNITNFQNFDNYHLTCEVGARVDFILNDF